MKNTIQKLLNYKTLDALEAKNTLLSMGRGEVNSSLMASFLTIFMLRSITVEELIGFRNAMIEMCLPIDLSAYEPMDVCGTGGDGKDTFNISTTAAFVVAGTGQRVAKHGNHGVSSLVGSSTVLEHLGYRFTNDSDALKRQIEVANICFLHAPLFHPAMKHIAPIRKELGLKTFFNLLGPLVNPARVKKQIVGVYSLEIGRLYHYLLQRESESKFLILHALDGFDEVSLTGDVKFASHRADGLLRPSDFGFERITLSQISGGHSLADSSKILTNILQNKGTKAQTEVVLANAGLALFTVNSIISLSDAIAEARYSIESGKAWQCFRKMMEN